MSQQIEDATQIHPRRTTVVSDYRGPEPNEPVLNISQYATPRPLGPIDLELAGNEGSVPPKAVTDAIGALEGEDLRRYPDLSPLRNAIAERHEVDADRVLVTAGGDQAIDLLARAFLNGDRTLLTHEPSFVMIERAGRLAGGSVETIEWTRGSFPVDTFIDAGNPDTALAVVVSPNNPTGTTMTADELRTVASELAPALVVIDHAYVEFADEDLTEVCLELPNVAVIRTFSKAMGLAGTRVGYLLGPPNLVDWLRRIRSPYPVPTPSLVAANERLDATDDVTGFIEAVRTNRKRLSEVLASLGVDVYPSAANFVLGEYRDARWTFEGLASLGIRTRLFPDRPYLEDHLRITIPGETEAIERVEHSLRTTLAPEAILFDLDGVLADVRESYRLAIIETAGEFGVEVTRDEIETRKHAGDANNDWEVTHGFLEDAGVDVSFTEVKELFQAHYLGEDGERDPLYTRERLLGEQVLDSLTEAYPLGIVTGRPQEDADRFLDQAGIAEHFDAVVCMEDAPNKPEPDPVKIALDRLGISRAWLIGDTPDDVRAARRAGVVPLGIVPPGGEEASTETALLEAGAARVLDDLDELLELLSNATSEPRIS